MNEYLYKVIRGAWPAWVIAAPYATEPFLGVKLAEKIDKFEWSAEKGHIIKFFNVFLESLNM